MIVFNTDSPPSLPIVVLVTIPLLEGIRSIFFKDLGVRIVKEWNIFFPFL